MKLSEQVCKLEQAKKLWELDIENDDAIFWHYLIIENEDYAWKCGLRDGNSLESYPAYTVAELGMMIGKGTYFSQAHWQWLLDCVNSGLSGTVAYNPVALAGFVITYLENNLTTAAEVNNRLNPLP